MTAMQEALTVAGVKLKSQMERVWTFVRDKPGCESKRVASELKLPQTSTLLWQMKKRGMVVPSTTAGRRGRKTTWAVEPSMRGVYERLPIKVARQVAEPLKPALQVYQEPTKVEASSVNLDDLTVKEARDLYKALHKMFG